MKRMQSFFSLFLSLSVLSLSSFSSLSLFSSSSCSLPSLSSSFSFFLSSLSLSFSYFFLAKQGLPCGSNSRGRSGEKGEGGSGSTWVQLGWGGVEATQSTAIKGGDPTTSRGARRGREKNRVLPLATMAATPKAKRKKGGRGAYQ